MDIKSLMIEVKNELKEEFKWVVLEKVDFIPNCIRITVRNDEGDFVSIFKNPNDLGLMNARKENLISHINNIL